MLAHVEFQSTLPRGSDAIKRAGGNADAEISIHAPSRERPNSPAQLDRLINFNPRSLAGATIKQLYLSSRVEISIHAPSRERPCSFFIISSKNINFNPRSLAGATQSTENLLRSVVISIHAPSRERRQQRVHPSSYLDFNPRSLAGATASKQITSLFI